MEKKIEKKYVGEEKEFTARSWEDENYDIDEVIEFFKFAKEEGATHIQWRVSCDYDGCSDTCEVSTFYNKVESDEDFEKRLNVENLKKQNEQFEIERKDRETYERLKSRFENEK
jgi:hypothetical protein